MVAAMKGFFMNLVMTMTTGTPTPALMPALANLDMIFVVGLTIPMIGVFFALSGLVFYTRHFIGITEERRKIITDFLKTKSQESNK